MLQHLRKIHRPCTLKPHEKVNRASLLTPGKSASMKGVPAGPARSNATVNAAGVDLPESSTGALVEEAVAWASQHGLVCRLAGGLWLLLLLTPAPGTKA